MPVHGLVHVVWIAALALTFLLPAPARSWTWTLVTLVYLGVVTWGVVSIRSSLFGRAILRGAGADRVALTFDDGPDPESTPALLELLREHRARATFFVVGERARTHPEIVRRCRDEGHEIGNHSDRHSALLNFRLRGPMRHEIEACQTTLFEVAGDRARYYRPPVGLRNPAVHPACAELGLAVVGWQVHSRDKTLDAARSAARVLRDVRPGGIVLLHDGGQQREHVLGLTEAILLGLEQRGWRSVGLTELLGG